MLYKSKFEEVILEGVSATIDFNIREAFKSHLKGKLDKRATEKFI
ncbi:hypothetical protein [Clostridium perfringens]|nr:hypothetical protein [Clostridium perfringens]